MDQIRRGYLWGKSDSDRQGMSLLNWETVCTPKKWGGMGVAQLKNRNIAMLLKWWWKPYTDPSALWTAVIRKLRGKGMQNGPNIWQIGGSFFWKQLQRIRPIFHWSTQWSVGTGSKISLWFDSWQGMPLNGNLDPGAVRPILPSISLEEAVQIWNILPIPATTQQPILSDEIDELNWRWEATGTYSAKSAYTALTGGGMISWRFTKIWKLKVPPTVRIFTYLVLKGKILTRDELEKRGMVCDMNCVMCTRCPTETALHLLFQCPYAMSVWNRVAVLMGTQVMAQRGTIMETWEASELISRGTGNLSKSVWAASFTCTCWFLWKNRNTVIFGGIPVQANMLADRICIEIG